jgi:hypothetical protein
LAYYESTSRAISRIFVRPNQLMFEAGITQNAVILSSITGD